LGSLDSGRKEEKKEEEKISSMSLKEEENRLQAQRGIGSEKSSIVAISKLKEKIFGK